MDTSQSFRILLVDDSATQRLYLRDCIRDEFPGVEIAEADSYEAALDLINQNRAFLAAVVDLCLPDDHEQKGLNVLEHLRRVQPTCMRILVTSRLRERDVRDKSNVEAFVSIHHSKSSALSMLFEALNEAIRRYWIRYEHFSLPATTSVGSCRSV